MVADVDGATRNLSFLLQCSPELDTGVTRVRILDIQDDEAMQEVSLRSATFLVRIAIGHGRVLERCFIRHIASAREAYVQGGPGLSRFVQDCLLDNGPAAAHSST